LVIGKKPRPIFRIKQGYVYVAKITISELIKAGLHFGHAASSWNPKMAPYIHGIKNKVHIFDMKQTAKSIIAAIHMAKQYAGEGKKAMFVGTKVQAQSTIRDVAIKTNSYYVNERWLGGLLTNHEVILNRLGRLDELEHIITEEASNYSKKMMSSFKREHKKLVRDLGGVRGMENLPDIIFLIDPSHEHIASNEANICNIPLIALTDSNSNPDSADLVIPGNDDAIRSIEFVLGNIADALLEGQEIFKENRAKAEAEAQASKEAPTEEGQTQEEAPAEETAGEEVQPVVEA
jgi:small subunit ribosomal protein S2